MGRTHPSRRRTFWVALPILLLSALATALVFRLATTDLIHTGTIVPRPLDLLLGLLFLAALAMLVIEYHRERDMLTWWLTLSVGVNVVAQAIMAFSKSPYDVNYDMAHAYMAMAYVVPIVGFPLCQIATAVERREALHALSDQRSIFGTVLSSTPDLIALKNLHFVYEAANSAFCRYVDRDEREVVGRSDYELFPKDRAEHHHRTDARVVESGMAEIREEQVSRDGQDRWFHTFKAPVHDDEGNMIAVFSSVRDITEVKQMEEKLRAMSNTDELTGLLNRRGFYCAGEQCLKKIERDRADALVIYMDLDNLKPINDRLGHEEGDRALRDMADVLRHAFRQSDVIARVGGDEFIVLALEAPEEQYPPMVERLEQRLHRHNETSDRPYQLSVSVGVARYNTESSESLDDIVSQADSRMYQQKLTKRQNRGASQPPESPG